MAQTCSGEEVGREDTREKEEEEADVMRCGVVWCDDKRWKGQGQLLFFLTCR